MKISGGWTSRCFVLRSFFFSLILLQCFGRAAASVDSSFLSRKLCKPPLLETSLSDLTDPPPLSTVRIQKNTHSQQRFDLLKNFPISSMIAAPGHRVLNQPQQLEGLIQYIRQSNGGDFRKDPILLNLITDSQDRVAFVDVWNAHHRLVAYLHAGYQTLGSLNPNNIEILVNGSRSNGEEWAHYLPIAGVDLNQLKNFSPLPLQGTPSIRSGSIKGPGKDSNFSLGSRTSMGKLHESSFTRFHSKIGVYFGHFDPLHEGHIQNAKQALKELGLSQVIFYPEKEEHTSLRHRPSLRHRIQLMKIRFANEPTFNTYCHDEGELASPSFNQSAVIERLIQTFGSQNIYQILSQKKLKERLDRQEVDLSQNLQYAVYRKTLTSPPVLPALAQNRVSFLSKSQANLQDFSVQSSHSLREALRQKMHLSTEVLNSEEADYIEQNHLYSNPTPKQPPPL